ENIKLLNIEVKLRDTALVTLRQKLDKEEKDRDDFKMKLEKFHTSFKNLTELLASQTIPPPYTGTFMLPKPDLVFNNAPTAVENDHLAFNVQLSPTKPVQDLFHTNRPSAPIIEDWLSDSDTESEPKALQFVPSFAQSSEHVKSPRHSIQLIETTILAATPALASLTSNYSGKKRNRKACFVCKSVDHLIKDCDFHTKKMAQPTQRNYAHRGHNKQYAPLTHSKPQKHMVPTVVLPQSNPVSNIAVRPVSAALPNIIVSQPRHDHHVVTKFNTPIRRHITRSPSLKTRSSPPIVTVVQAPVVSAAQGNQGTWELNGGYVAFGGNPKGGKITGKGKIKTGNMSYLSKFKELNGGYVAFGGNPKGGKITGKGTGPTWLFDIDSLTRTMNYQPVTVGNQTNFGIGFQDKFDAEKVKEEVDQTYVLFLVWSAGSTNPQNNDEDAAFDEKEHDFDAMKHESVVILYSSSRYKDLNAEFEDCSNNSSNEVNAAGSIVLTVGQNTLNNTNTFSVAGPSNTTVSPTYGKSSSIEASQLPDDPNLLELEDITYSDDEDVFGVEADFNNLESSIPKEPKRVHHALKDLSWIEAMQEEILQFKMQKVWVLVDLPYGKRAISSKWVYRNKKDERGIVIRNKARLVKQKKNGIFICKDKYVAEILKKFGLTEGKSASTPIDTEKLLLKDSDGEDVDVHTYSAGSIKFNITSTSSDSPLLGVNTPRSDENRFAIMELTIFLLPKIEWFEIGVNAADLKVSAVRHQLLLFSLTNWCCSLSAVRSSRVDCLPNKEIFAELARMGYEKPSKKLTLYKAFFSIQWKFLIHTIIQSMSAKRTSWNEFSLAMASAVICFSTGADNVVQGDDAQEPSIPSPTPPTPPPQQSHDLPSTSQDALDACAALTRRVEHLEYDKVAQALKITKLKRRVKKLEKGNMVKFLKLRRLKKVQQTPPHSPQVQPPSPQPQPQPQQATKFTMNLLQKVMDTYAA
nr:putative ribonuclease H-like domain-containing protein [Tanacetum cinerariifolium]